MDSEHVTKDFKWIEFRCRNGEPVPDHLKNNVRNLCTRILQPLRDSLGKPVRITSAYRPEPYNTQVGGVRGSQHTLAKAADIFVPGMSTYDLYQYLERFNPPGMGYYPNHGFIHVDIRNTGRARWIG